MKTKLLLSFLAVVASPVLAAPIQCDHMQTHCVTDDNEVTIGDRVGFFNDDGELVAQGEVRAMKGERRAVLISERHGPIRKNYRMALLETNNSNPDAVDLTNVHIYHEPAKLLVGASLGYSEVSIGQGSPATELSAYGQYRKWGGFALVGRATYLAMEGQVTHFTQSGSELLPISMRGIGLLGGASYTTSESKPISLRTEAAVGGMDVQADVGGDKSLVGSSQTNSRIKNGVGFYGRGTLGAVWNLGSFHMTLDYAPSLVYQAFANTIAAGATMELK